MHVDEMKACQEWLLESTSVDWLWGESLEEAACKAAAAGRIDVLTYMLEAVHSPNGEKQSHDSEAFFGQHVLSKKWKYSTTSPMSYLEMSMLMWSPGIQEVKP